MNRLQQTLAVTALGLRSIPQRWGAAVVAVTGIAGVVLVLISVLSIGEGIRAMLETGDADVVVVLKHGITQEMSSFLTQEQVTAMTPTAQFASDAAGPLVSAESMLTTELRLRRAASDAYAIVRGLSTQGVKLRAGFQLLQGRMFEPGTREVIVGTALARQFADIEIGRQINIRDTDWTVVGIFSADGGLAESEVWCDGVTMRSAYSLAVNSLRARLHRVQDLDIVRKTFAADPRLNVDVLTERDLHAAQSKKVVQPLRSMARVVALLMGIGAVFGALNTMYAAVAARTREIATLRALGFDAAAVMTSILVEALLLGGAGGLLGAMLSCGIVDGLHFSTMGQEVGGQMGFTFRVTSVIVAQGMLYALVLGFVGGLLPSRRAARLPITRALAA